MDKETTAETEDTMLMTSIFSLIDTLETDEQQRSARTLYEQYIDTMLACARTYFPNQTDAEDIVHDAFVRVIRNIDKFTDKPEYEVKALLRTYIYHVAMTLYNYRKKTATVAWNDAFEYDEPSEADVYPTENEPLDLLTYVKGLKEIDRMILLYRFHENYTVRAIAREFGMPESTVSTRLNRALAKIRKILKEKDHENG